MCQPPGLVHWIFVRFTPRRPHPISLRCPHSCSFLTFFTPIYLALSNKFTNFALKYRLIVVNDACQAKAIKIM